MQHLRIAIHLHTNYSFDSNFAPEQVVDAAEREGLDCIAITDHDAIDGARRARDLGRVRVIVGSEISTRDGHLIGLFLEKGIPAGLPALDTAEAIHAQGGVVLAPHPFASLCSGSLLRRTKDLLGHLDGIEIHNAQNPLGWQDRRAARFADRHNLPGYVGADTHIAGQLAPAWQEMPAFEGADGFRVALRAARPHFGRFGVKYLTHMGYRHFRDKLGFRPGRGFGANYWRMRGARAEVGVQGTG